MDRVSAIKIYYYYYYYYYYYKLSANSVTIFDRYRRLIKQDAVCIL